MILQVDFTTDLLGRDAVRLIRVLDQLPLGLVDPLPDLGRCLAGVLHWLLRQVIVVDLIVITLQMIVSIGRSEVSTVVAQLLVASPMLVEPHSFPIEAYSTLFVVEASKFAWSIGVILVSWVLVLTVVDTAASDRLTADRWQVALLLSLPPHVVVVASTVAVADLRESYLVA